MLALSELHASKLLNKFHKKRCYGSRIIPHLHRLASRRFTIDRTYLTRAGDFGGVKRRITVHHDEILF
jgi:hypothetical protein